MSGGRLRELVFGGSEDTVRGMRRKLTLMALAAFTVVLASVIVGISLLTWNMTCHRLDTLLGYIEETDGVLTDLGDIRSDASDYLLEVPYDTRYFTVTFDSQGTATGYDTASIASVPDEHAVEMGRDVLESGRTRGFEGVYRYCVVHDADTTKVYFLYAYSDLAYFQSFLWASIAMGILGLLAFIAVIFPFSDAAIRPVEEAQRQQRRFVTDASHELRTPLSIIQSALDVIEIEDGESEWTQSIHNQTKRLEDLTNKLVALAKADEGAGSLKLADMDLSAAALQIAEDFEAVSQAQGKPLSVDVASDIHVEADAGMVAQALSILLDNAFKHSPEGAQVSVTVRAASSGHAEIAVANDAADIASGPHPELFERFYKADAARTYAGGHGIGLAVVRAIARAHGGTAEAVSDGGRLCVKVVL